MKNLFFFTCLFFVLSGFGQTMHDFGSINIQQIQYYPGIRQIVTLNAPTKNGIMVYNPIDQRVYVQTEASGGQEHLPIRSIVAYDSVTHLYYPTDMESGADFHDTTYFSFIPKYSGVISLTDSGFLSRPVTYDSYLGYTRKISLAPFSAYPFEPKNSNIQAHIISAHQTIINGTGFVKASGTTLSFDNSTYSTTSHNHTGVYVPVGEIKPQCGGSADTTGISTTSPPIFMGYSEGFTVDTIVVWLYRRNGTPNITVKVYFGKDQSATGTPLVTAGNAITSYTTATKISTFDNSAIGSGNMVWFKFSSVSVIPKSVHIILIGHRS